MRLGGGASRGRDCRPADGTVSDRMRAGLLVLVCAALAGAADPPGSTASHEALALCQRAGDAPEAEQDALLARSLAMAETAVATDDGDALAHFAVFCSLGEQMRRAGVSVRALTRLRRLRREVDRTLVLAPDFADALAGKGALLLDTPRLLGGDPAAAVGLLQRAIEIDPGYLGPRLDLVRALLATAQRAAAHAEAERALEIATRRGRPKEIAAARELVAETAR